MLCSPAPALHEQASTVWAAETAAAEETEELEMPHPALGAWVARAALGGLLCGLLSASASWLPLWALVASFALAHPLGCLLCADATRLVGLLAMCAFFGFQAGASAAHIALFWSSGSPAAGPWSLFALFASLLYLQSAWLEALTLPADLVSMISLFFPVFPGYAAAVLLSCAEFFLEWRLCPDLKLRPCSVALGALLLSCGQLLVGAAIAAAQRHFYGAQHQGPPEEGEEAARPPAGPPAVAGFCGGGGAPTLLSQRRLVRDGPYRFDRHPAYLGMLLWGVGAELVLCNPVMALLVGLVLWATLLHVALEEEKELHAEFPDEYALYAAVTTCWIPFFDQLLREMEFHRVMVPGEKRRCQGGSEGDEDSEEECETGKEGEEGAAERPVDGDDMTTSAESEEDEEFLAAVKGVPRGGAAWNLQFRHPWDFQ